MRVAIIGGGISGLAAAHRLITSAPPASIQVTIFEGSGRLGGWIRTEQFAGRPVDFGPDSLLMRTPWASELCAELGIAQELVAPGGGGASLWTRGRLRPLPSGILAGLPNGPLPFVKSGLLSPLGVARAALDLVLPRNAPAGDESIGALVRRRLGAEALERVVDPLLGGVHAGRCDDLSLAATAPQIAVAARAHRSLLRGLRATAAPVSPASAGAADERSLQPAATEAEAVQLTQAAGPPPVFMGPRLGMARLVEALVGALEGVATLRAQASVTALEPLAAARAAASAEPGAGAAGVRIHLDGDPEPSDFDGVILAVPAPAAAALLAPHAAAATTPLTQLQYASVAHVALSYAAQTLPQLPPGTGFLVPRTEDSLMTACTLLDQKWPERSAAGAGDGTTVIKCSVGRIDDDRFQSMTDEEIVTAVHYELSEILGLSERPVGHRIFRVQDGLPQYAPGHLDRIAVLAEAVNAVLPALTLTGAAYRGTSVPVCIREGRAAADAQLARLLPPA